MCIKQLNNSQFNSYWLELTSTIKLTCMLFLCLFLCVKRVAVTFVCFFSMNHSPNTQTNKEKSIEIMYFVKFILFLYFYCFIICSMTCSVTPTAHILCLNSQRTLFYNTKFMFLRKSSQLFKNSFCKFQKRFFAFLNNVFGI